MNEIEEPKLPCANKLTFNTQREANAAALTALYQHGTKLKSYQCHHCNLWHLASKYS
jgi:hypothetical protein